MYCTREDIEDNFGIINVEKWADLDNDADQTKIAARIDHAIYIASAQIDGALRKTFYVVPLEPNGSYLDPVIVDICAIFAGVYLYEARGVSDFDPDSGQIVHRLKYNKQYAQDTLQKILLGPLSLDLLKENHIGPLG